MIELGRRQKLQVVKKVEFGVYLGEKADAKEQERVLLPAKQVPAETKVGDELEVFIYRDSADRLIATTRVPALELHQTAVVKVAEVGKIGAFLDWGLEKGEVISIIGPSGAGKSTILHGVNMAFCPVFC